VLAAIAIAYSAPDLALPWHPWANYGMEFAATGDRTAEIRSVSPGGPAARAGIRAGDTVDLAAMSFADRRSRSVPYNAELAGARATFQIAHGKSNRAVTLVAVPYPRTLADNVADVLQVFSECAFPVLAAFLLLLRPGILTWAFFIYALSTAGGAILLDTYVPTAVQLLEDAWVSAVDVAGVAAFIIFALRFPSNVTRGWKASAERLVLYIAIPLLMINLYASLGGAWLAPGTFAAGNAATFTINAGYVIGAAAFIATLLQATAQERPRVIWVILGFLIGYGGFRILLLIHYLTVVPIWLNDALLTLNVFVPITVMYAILKHRVIDVRFFLNRALVYGILTTIGIGLLALLDWAVARRLESFGLVVEAAGALLLGVGIQRLHSFVDAVVDRYVFRSVHEAEKHLARVAEAMMYAQSLPALDKLLVEESARALRLRSAAVFRREDRAFRREAAVGWSGVESEAFGIDDPLVLDLQAQKTGVARSPFLASRDDLPQGAAAPAFAVPIRIREQMTGFALFGAHVNASDIDPNEQQILQTFIARATIAYDHVSNLERAADNERMRIELDFLRGLVKPLPPSGGSPLEPLEGAASP
jgi:hypothetical protein